LDLNISSTEQQQQQQHGAYLEKFCCHGALYASTASVISTPKPKIMSTGCQLNKRSVDAPSCSGLVLTPPSW
jgi:hypothetical protein